MVYSLERLGRPRSVAATSDAATAPAAGSASALRRCVAALCALAIALPSARVAAQSRAARAHSAPAAESAAPERAAASSQSAASSPQTATPATPPTAATTGTAPPASLLNPLPQEFPGKLPPPAAPGELDAVLSRLAALRSRVAALTAALFSSRLRVELRVEADTARVKTLSVTLDGGVVFTAGPRAAFEQPEVVFEHAVAPGAHILGVEVERSDPSRPELSTWQASRFVIVVPEKRVLFTRLELEDASSMGEDFVEDEAGEYDLRVRLLVEAGD